MASVVPSQMMPPASNAPAIPHGEEDDEDDEGFDGGRETVADNSSDEYVQDFAFASRYTERPVPTKGFPKHSYPAAAAYQIVQDHRQLDANPRMNLASFVTTWMEPEAEQIMLQALNVNLVDASQYRSCTQMEQRCISMLADLYHAPDAESAPGSACIGSSEAAMLAALSLKKAWASRRRSEGKDAQTPNIVMGAHVHVCWLKFATYFEVEQRLVPVSEGCYVTTAERARPYIDENTIGIIGLLGSTYTGEYDDIAALDRLSKELQEEKGWRVPIHVDAASGGFVAPFVAPDLLWDFRLDNVVSINVSGHKYGLVYPGVGWIVFRAQEELHNDLRFSTKYLGSNQPNTSLNFSRSAAHVVAQYYQFLRLGWHGYRAVMTNLMKITKRLRKGILRLGVFKLVSNMESLPLAVFSIDHEHPDAPKWDEFDFADKIKERSWQMPAYTMAPSADHVKVIRIVVREDMSATKVEALLTDMRWTMDWLQEHYFLAHEDIGRLNDNKHSMARQTSKVAGRTCA